MKALSEAGVPLENDQSALTLREFAELFGMTPRAAGYRLSNLIQAGKAVKTYKLSDIKDRGRKMRCIAYRLL
jgi:hypothetical protein